MQIRIFLLGGITAEDREAIEICENWRDNLCNCTDYYCGASGQDKVTAILGGPYTGEIDVLITNHRTAIEAMRKD